MTLPPTSCCPGCGVELAKTDGPIHRYMTSSPACWAKYGELLGREYENPVRMAVHQYTVDAFAVQHPGDGSPQAKQSVAVHLASLYAMFELGRSPSESPALLQRLTSADALPVLTRPANVGALTAVHALAATTDDEHAQLVVQWAQCCWQAWGDHHAQIQRWVERRL